MTEKNEMSSESTEQDLAQETSDATASTEEETTEEKTSPADELAQKEPTVPLHEHTALRTRAQDAELQAANLRGQLTAIEQQQSRDAPATKSPLDLEIERQAAEGIDEDDMVISPRIIKAQEAYNQQVANQTATATAKEQLTTKQLASARKAIAVHDDWQSVVKAADRLMTPGELVDLGNAGDNFGELAYAKAKAVLERNKSEANPKSKTDTAPEKESSEQEAKKKEAEEKEKAKKEAPSQDDILKNASPATAAAFKL